ncbi:MAG: hypothetical protein ACWIPJ_06000 [Polaribacter sp.]
MNYLELLSFYENAMLPIPSIKPLVKYVTADAKQYKELKENLIPQDQIYFMDGVHLYGRCCIRNTMPLQDLDGKKGQTKHLKTNNGRKNQYKWHT